jgi:hypothetical protein
METSQVELKYNDVVNLYEGSGYTSLMEFWSSVKSEFKTSTEHDVFEALNEKIIVRHGDKINS